MKTKLLVATLLAGSSLFAETNFSIGIGVGGHGYAAPPVMAYRPHSPGPGYVWVDGYWDQAGPRRFWHEGYWARSIYRGAYEYDRAYAIGPRYDTNRYEGNRYGERRDNGYVGNRDSNSYGRNSYNDNRASGNGPNGNSHNSSNGGNRANGNSFN